MEQALAEVKLSRSRHSRAHVNEFPAPGATSDSNAMIHSDRAGSKTRSASKPIRPRSAIRRHPPIRADLPHNTLCAIQPVRALSAIGTTDPAKSIRRAQHVSHAEWVVPARGTLDRELPLAALRHLGLTATNRRAHLVPMNQIQIQQSAVISIDQLAEFGYCVSQCRMSRMHIGL